MWRIIILCIITNLTAAEKATFENYKVFKVIPVKVKQYKLLENMILQHGYYFWEDPPILLKKPMKLMVTPHKLPEFYEIMNKQDIFYELLINNVQELVNQSTQSTSYSEKTEYVYSSNPNNPNIPNVYLDNPNMFSFTKYPTLKEIDQYLNNLILNYTDKIKPLLIGKSYQNRTIFGVKVSFNNQRKNPGIFLEGGIHANEWISPVTILYILHQLMTSTNPDVRALAESHDWYIFPLLNPDGYEYTHTTNRLWKKSRRPVNMFCTGVDLNRNWNHKWNRIASTRNPCSNMYSGPRPFSERETIALKRYIYSISDKFYAYISFHSSSQNLMFPYGYKTFYRDPKYDLLYSIGLNATAALKRRYGTEYGVGSVIDVLHFATGTSIDYVMSTYDKYFVYCYDLRDRNYYNFLLPSDHIIPTGQETLDSLVSMFQQIKIRIMEN